MTASPTGRRDAGDATQPAQRGHFERPEIADSRYVVDRDGHVWAVVRDGGMVMRANEASASGVTSAGIVWLENTNGPLLPFDPAAYRRAYPRVEQ